MILKKKQINIFIASLVILFCHSCKDHMEEKIIGTYFNNEYKLEIRQAVGENIHGHHNLYNKFTLYKWEEVHKTFFKNEFDPGYYEIQSGYWEIENGYLKIEFYTKDEFENSYFQIIPINNHSFILRGSEQNFFSDDISQGYHSD